MANETFFKLLPGNFTIEEKEKGYTLLEAKHVFNHLGDDDFKEKNLIRVAAGIKPVICATYEQVKDANAAQLFTAAKVNCTNPILDQEQVVAFFEKNPDQLVENSYMHCFIRENGKVILCSVGLCQKTPTPTPDAFTNFSNLTFGHVWKGEYKFKIILPIN